jgi:nicotinamide-nucleotide amidase
VTFEQSLVELLLSNDMTITCVESCTGGLVSAALVGVPGASDVFKSSFVTYSNKAKRKLAGVSKDTLDRYTAVSAQTAQEMAEGGAKAAGSDVCISVTGLAGPGGGTRKKPVGLVYIGCFVRGRVRVNEYHFSGDRNNVRMLAAKNALILARECILEYIDNK